MTRRPDPQTLANLADDHAQFEHRIRHLLDQPGPPGEWASELDAFTVDIMKHLRAEAVAVLPRLEEEGEDGHITAEALRKSEERIRADLEQMNGRDTLDTSKLLLLSYDLGAHGAHADMVFRDWQARASVPPPRPVAAEAATVVSGMLVGAAVGAVAGPLGAAGGAAVGGITAAVAKAAMHVANVRHSERDAELDRDIGVIGGHIGEASPNAPPARIGAFSSAACGAGGGGGDVTDDAAGPIPEPVSRD